jgi:hypothetical protein
MVGSTVGSAFLVAVPTRGQRRRWGFFYETNTLINFVLASHRRNLLLTDLRQNLENAIESAQIPSTSILPLCPTVWTMRTSLTFLLVIYSLLTELFTSLTETEHGETGADY